MAASPSISALADSIAAAAHDGQLDKAGNPYIGHVRRVAGYVDPADQHAVAAALLHDIVEDTAVTPADLTAAGLPGEVVDAVVLLTRYDGLAPEDYYTQIRRHPLAREVKLADLADNTDPSRLALLPPERQAKLTRKYAAAYQALGADDTDGHRRRQQHRGVPG
ncbi:HD domain-containing protein [Mycolicibacterium sp.]|uniref:HD domain-containing protein n=1 Tax=Mycolicibacterium sp. TaxID=2320850 RepID=UPI003D0E3111